MPKWTDWRDAFAHTIAGLDQTAVGVTATVPTLNAFVGTYKRKP